MADVADVRIAPTPNVIEHEQLKRRITVSANVRGRDLGSVPGAFQLKYYARGVGNISIGWTGDDPNKETMDLVDTRCSLA